MIAFALFALAAAQAAAQDAAAPERPVERSRVVQSRLVIPDEIGAAVMPYMGCLLARNGTEVRGSFDPRPGGVGPGADCTPFRERGAREAEVLLRRIGGRSREERAELIERTLASIDAFAAASAAVSPPESGTDAPDR